MQGSEGYRAVVELPEKSMPIGVKRVAGPLAPISGRYAVIAGYVAPRPDWVRVEPHIVVLPDRGAARPGFYVVEGAVVIARHEGLRRLFSEAVSGGLARYVHVAGWGVPVIVASGVREADEALRRILRALGAEGMLEWLLGVAGRIEVRGEVPRLYGPRGRFERRLPGS